MNQMPWFRMFHEARNDAKLRLLTDAEFRVWFNLLCLSSEQRAERGTIPQMDPWLLAAEVANGDESLLEGTLAKLTRLRIVERTEDDGWCFINFLERQYDKPSDQRLPWPKWAVLRTLVFLRDNHTCQYCGSTTGPFECDHIIPISRGGNNDLSNLTTACRHCNRAKSDRLPEEWQR